MRLVRQLALLLMLLLSGPALHAQDVLPVPPLSARVIDQTETLSPADLERLRAKLAAFEAEAGAQIVVLLVPTTQPEDIAAYAQRVGETWKIGRRDIGDGLLIVVAKNERRVNIQTTKALEGAVPDLAARHIIDQAIRPAFRANDYAGGLDAALDQLMARIRGESLPAPAGPSERRGGASSNMSPADVLVFAFVALPLVASVARRLFGRGPGALASAGLTGALAWLVSGSLALVALGVLIGGLFGLFAGASRMLASHGRGGSFGGGFGGGGWGSGGGWSSGGGGFSSGGGGDFGGGGSSGSW